MRLLSSLLCVFVSVASCTGGLGWSGYGSGSSFGSFGGQGFGSSFGSYGGLQSQGYGLQSQGQGFGSGFGLNSGSYLGSSLGSGALMNSMTMPSSYQMSSKEQQLPIQEQQSQPIVYVVRHGESGLLRSGPTILINNASPITLNRGAAAEMPEPTPEQPQQPEQPQGPQQPEGQEQQEQPSQQPQPQEEAPAKTPCPEQPQEQQQEQPQQEQPQEQEQVPQAQQSKQQVRMMPTKSSLRLRGLSSRFNQMSMGSNSNYQQ